MKSPRIAPLDAATARRLAAIYGLDPRTLQREVHAPGSVRGLAGERARAAMAELRATNAKEIAP